jgi:hypothetical protein
MPRPNLQQRRLAVRLARKYRDKFDGDMEKVEAALKEDENLVGIDPATIILIIELVMAAIKFFRSRNVSGIGMDDEEVLAAINAQES